ncbi:MAG: hypothetical protein C5B58_14115 [Acidobacteria bacterium]|nr:MAG: hypothetical protein C5B58_14115 [Acidobacteriota bacterium]
MRKSKRPITRAKMYGFNPYADQVDDINRLVAESGQNEATVLRKLIDEALMVRRRKAADAELEEAGTDQLTIVERLESLERLLIQSVQQGDTNYRMQDVSLALIQDTLAESRAHRKLTWKQLAPTLKEQGLNAKEIAKRFDEETDEAKDFAYGTAQDLKKQQEK